MRSFLLLLFLNLFCIALTAQSTDTFRVHNNTYLVRNNYTGYSREISFFLLHDTSTVKLLSRQTDINAYDEFGGQLLNSSYVLQGDSLIYYTSNTVYGEQTNTGTPSTTTTSKEVFVFRKNGQLVRLTCEYGENNAALRSEIQQHIYSPAHPAH